MSEAASGVKMECTRTEPFTCGHEWTYTGEKQGGPVTCPRCGTSVMIPREDDDEEDG